MITGIKIVDYYEFECGMCCNGGHYSVITEFEKVGNKWAKHFSSSYEDSDWESEWVTVDEVLDALCYAIEHKHDECLYHNDDRFEITKTRQ